MRSLTKPITVNGWVRLGDAIRTAGYAGEANLSELQIINTGATPVYIHLTDNGLTNPSTGTDGVPVGSTAPSTVWGFSQNIPDVFLDANKAWLYTASSISIKVLAIGGGG